MKFDAFNRLVRLHRELGLPGKVEYTRHGAFIIVQSLGGNEADAEKALRKLKEESTDGKALPVRREEE